MTLSPQTQARSFDQPQEPEWHRMIAEAAYYLAQKRGFFGEHALDDWITAEQQVRQAISPIPKFKNDAITPMPPGPGARKSAALPNQLQDGQIYAHAT